MLLDNLLLNFTPLYTSIVLINIFYLNDKLIYYILILDVIFNGLPIVTIIIILLYYFTNYLFIKINNTFITKYILILIYYFVFGIILYSIFNEFNFYILTILLKNFVLNALIMFLGLKYKTCQYN